MKLGLTLKIDIVDLLYYYVRLIDSKRCNSIFIPFVIKFFVFYWINKRKQSNLIFKINLFQTQNGSKRIINIFTFLVILKKNETIQYFLLAFLFFFLLKIYLFNIHALLLSLWCIHFKR